jgi:hypothetical protein
MKRPIMFFPVTLLALVVAVGCNQVAPSTAPPKNSASVTYDSVAVLPITGELQIKFQGGPETPKTFLQHEFPEELASEIAKQRGSGAFKVISPAVVQEYQLRRLARTTSLFRLFQLLCSVGARSSLARFHKSSMRSNYIVPLWKYSARFHIDTRFLFLAHLHFRRIDFLIQSRSATKARVGLRVADEL